MENSLSTIEKMIGGEFSSDPRCSKFPLPEIPEGTPDGISYTHSGYVVTPEIAKDWVQHRSIRRDVMPRDLTHDNVVPNRKYLISYLKTFTKKLQQPDWWDKGIHQGLAFTPDGFILDGQHRLAACVLSGVPIILPVAVNVPWASFNNIDQNRHRSAHQMLDIPYATAAASVAKHLLPVLDNRSATDHVYGGREYNEQVIEICLGWPYFAEDQAWMKEIYEAASESGIPSGPLGAVCIGGLAGGVPADDVQQFLNGLRPLSRDVKYITIGTNGDDPRRLLARHFKKQKDARGSNNRNSLTFADQRANAGTIRYCFDVWMRRNSDDPKKIKTIQRWPATSDLPPFINEREIREFHTKHVN